MPGIGIGGHGGKEGLERGQPAGRGADADDGKARVREDARVCPRGRLRLHRRLERCVPLCLFLRRGLLLQAGFLLFSHHRSSKS